MTPPTPADLLRLARDPSFWRRTVPSLRIDEPRLTTWPADGMLTAERARLGGAGYARLERAVPMARVEALAGGLESLHHARIPTPALYVFDEPWELAAGLAPTLEALLGAPPRVLADVWAWRVPSEAGASGWAPHRGVSYDVRDANGAPALVNAWIALSDVSEASACIHVVPLPHDPHHPGALDRIDVDPARAIALPVPAGSVLVWNANVVHWGGAMTPGAPPRLSMSFSFRTTETAGDFAPSAPPAFSARVGLLADMLVAYAPVAGVGGAWLEWARLWSGMRGARRTAAT